MRADRTVERSLPRAKADFRFEPLPAFVDQVHHRDRRLTDVACDLGDVVERRLGRGVENPVGAQRLQPLRFVGMESRRFMLV
jgi:hypothetical protein